MCMAIIHMSGIQSGNPHYPCQFHERKWNGKWSTTFGIPGLELSTTNFIELFDYLGLVVLKLTLYSHNFIVIYNYVT